MTLTMTASPSSRSDLLGVGVFAAAVSWSVAAGHRAGFALPPAGVLLLGSAAALILARLATRWWRGTVPLTLTAVAGVLQIVNFEDVVGAAPLGGPFGYANATGAFFAQAVVAGLMLAAGSERLWAKAFGIIAAAVFTAAVFILGSIAPGILVVLGMIMVVRLRPRGVVASCAVLLGAALVASVALGATYRADTRSDLVDRVVDASITERRVALWHDALGLIVTHPLSGVGAGGFALMSSIARDDTDARWAHNEFLQQGAEAGIAGLVLLISVFAWGFGRLWVVETPDLVTSLGAVSLAALGVHACIDYVLHFPMVALTAAAVVGAAQAPKTMVAAELPGPVMHARSSR